ncbi:MAG: hypothetical protein M3360_00565 [Actinomycetota bacterium]|nr:hypothetical protein [Actinomycetota bacterium]
MRIDCTECAMYQSEHCDDCLVTALLHPPHGAVEIDDDLEPPLVALSGAGLLPVLKFRSRPSGGTGAPGSDPGSVVEERSA